MASISVKNVFSVPATVSKEEIFEKLASGRDVLVERILSYGQTTPPGSWYDQKKDEWVVLLQGRATLFFEDEGPLELKAGDSLLIPRHKKHRVTYTSAEPPCVWIAVHANLE